MGHGEVVPLKEQLVHLSSDVDKSLVDENL
jgi:hypothetical protein